MQVSTTRALSNLAGAGLFLAGLFVLVALLQVTLVTALRGAGLSASLALLISGAAILSFVLAAAFGAQAWSRRRRAALAAEARALGLPEGPCCVIWRGGPEGDFPWELEGDVRALYPPLARRLGAEGVAVIDFEVSADGRAKNLHPVDCWPSPLFYEAAAAALRAARFRMRQDAPPRFGPSYRIPFVFRIKGAARVRDRGRSAFGPALYRLRRAARELVDKSAAHLRNLKRV